MGGMAPKERKDHKRGAGSGLGEAAKVTYPADMRMLLLALSVLIGLPLWAAPLPEGKVVSTETYRGVIFTPGMLKAQDVHLFDEERHATYWTPSREVIDKAENLFRRELTKAYLTVPSEGFHYREWYTPKQISMDRGRAQPIEFFSDDFYGWDPKEAAIEYRQYVGVTIEGKQALYVRFIGNGPNPGFDWKSEWPMFLGGDSDFFYVPQIGELSEWPF